MKDTGRVVKRIILIVLDSVGCGDAPDAAFYGDLGANTLGNISRAVGGLNLPNLGLLGLGNTTQILGVPPEKNALGAFGRLTEVGAGKDTTAGHWELAGVILNRALPVFPSGFPISLIKDFERRIGRSTLGNIAASGTEILKELGEEHVRTGQPIVYTSADSVFQIAAHEEVINIEELYSMCRTAREMLMGDYAVGRVIARPFVGIPGNFKRTERRQDFSQEPPENTILDVLKNGGHQVIGVGKIEDIFAHRGLTKSLHTGNNMAGIDAIVELLEMDTSGLIFANLVDFDALYGHRNDPSGYARALEEFDRRLPEITSRLKTGDILMITADHGNDPTDASTDHSRERVPILAFGKTIKQNHVIGTRTGFADLGATIVDFIGISWEGPGSSFANEILKDF